MEDDNSAGWGESVIDRAAPIKVSLKWQSGGDLDLHCFYVTASDETGKVYHKNMGDPKTPPCVYLDHDNRKKGAETVTMADPDALKYVLAAAYREFDSGAGSFASAQASAIVSNAAGQTMEITLREKNEYAYWVALALLDFTDPACVRISKTATYAEADVEQAPVLNKDGTFQMGAGEVEFKEVEKKCFVATGVYGSYDAPEVVELRRFRDQNLIGTCLGKVFLRFYYLWSPYLAKFVAQRPMLRQWVRRWLLDPLVQFIRL